MKQPRTILLLIGTIFLAIPFAGTAQELSQVVKGKIIEKETRAPLLGASVGVRLDSTRMLGTTTDVNGLFRFEKVPIGRHQVRVSYLGYKGALLSNVEVTSTKEVILDISLEPLIDSLSETIVVGTHDGDVSNDMAYVSAVSFTIEETQRYAGSRGDPARMASNFAGVQGADDSRNDIVIRGNSPQAVLWRMEGINIPNPNHFNIPGTAGGPVSMINNKTLANSDFFTGAFPAEFGNTVGGVFDLKLRNGNDEKHEFAGQLGFLGTEAFAEGPLSKKGNGRNPSYLVSYRYSTLALFSKLHIDIGTSAIPHYQDFGFKFNFPQKNGGSFSVFSLGGSSNIDIMVSEQKEPDRNIYGENDRDQHFKTQAATFGMSYKYPVRKTGFLSATIAASNERVRANDDYVYRHLDGNQHYVLDSTQYMLGYTFNQNKISAALLYSVNPGRRHLWTMGVNADYYFFNFVDSTLNIDPTSPDFNTWRRRWDSRSQSLLLQPFVQWKYSLSDKADLSLGVHSQYFSLSNSLSAIEPRAGFKVRTSDKSAFNVGLGLHSQIQPTYMYFYGQTNDAAGNPVPANTHIGFTRSFHIVGGYEHFLAEDIRLKTEVYYQYLFNIPVEQTPSSFSLVNTGAGFSRFFPGPLVNTGLGRNYGVELTVEKFFTHHYLFLLTGSLFEAKYQGSDHVWRNTDFNGKYAVNALFTREWTLGKSNRFSAGTKLTSVGGRWYGPVDEVASEKQKDVVYVDATRNTLQFAPYFRLDLRVTYKISRPKVSHEFAVDLVNITGKKNILKLTYSPNDLNPSASPIREEYQLGFLPLFYYRIEF